MTSSLPPHVRPLTYAGIELLLDLLHYARQLAPDADLESLFIILCVTEATMRPFMLDPSKRRQLISLEGPPQQHQGSISRRLISDKTGLPRETVRRKVADLADAGHLVIDAHGRVSARYRLSAPAVQAALGQAHKAAQRYMQRLAEFDVDSNSIG